MQDGPLVYADSLVAALNAGQAEGAFGAGFLAEWKDDPTSALDDDALQMARLWVIDFSGERNLQQHVPMIETELLLVLQQKLTAEAATGVCRQLAQLTDELVAFCHRNPLAIGADGDPRQYAAICVRTERLRCRDFNEYRTAGLFRSEIYVHYRAAGD